MDLMRVIKCKCQDPTMQEWYRYKFQQPNSLFSEKDYKL